MGIEITRSCDVAASPDDVAAFVTDLQRWPDWFALHKGWSDDKIPTEARKGVKFKHKVRVLGLPGDVTWEVEDLQPPERFVLKGKGPNRTNMGVDFRIAPNGDGSNVSFTATIGGLTIKPIEGKLKTWIEERVDRTVVGLERELG